MVNKDYHNILPQVSVVNGSYTNNVDFQLLSVFSDTEECMLLQDTRL